jgi:hypothetical protein
VGSDTPGIQGGGSQAGNRRGHPAAESPRDWECRLGACIAGSRSSGSRPSNDRQTRTRLRSCVGCAPSSSVVTEERDIPKKGPPRTLPSSPGEVRVHQEPREQHSVRRMCGLLDLHPSGYYAGARRRIRIAPLTIEGCSGASAKLGWKAAASTAIARCAMTMRDLGESCGANRGGPVDARRRNYAPNAATAAGLARMAASPRGRAKPPAAGVQRIRSRTAFGSPTSPTTERTKDGCTWPWSWICSRARWWVGLCSRGSTGNWP